MPPGPAAWDVHTSISCRSYYDSSESSEESSYYETSEESDTEDELEQCMG